MSKTADQLISHGDDNSQIMIILSILPYDSAGHLAVLRDIG
jgi:hypothetical protein